MNPITRSSLSLLLGAVTLLTSACASDPASEGGNGPPAPRNSAEVGAVTTVEPAPTAPSVADAAPPPPPPAATVLEACTAFAATYCSTLMQKAPDVISNIFVDEASCRSFRLERCSTSDNAPDTGWTTASRAQCTAALATATLQDLVMLTIPACQDPPGKKPEGAACMLVAQCASGHCRRDAGANCGACGPLVKTGDACITYTDCGPREDCVARGSDQTPRCVPIAAVNVGDPCATMDGCDGSRYCKGTFVPTGQPNGWSVVGGTCQAAVPAKVGSGCGAFYADLSNGNFELTEQRSCPTTNSWCKVAPGASTGACVALATIGQSCGDGCGGALICESGTCQPPAPASCK